MTRFQAAEDLSGQAIGIGVGVGDDIAGVDDEIRPLGEVVNEFDNPFGAGERVMVVAGVIGRGADGGVADVDEVARLGRVHEMDLQLWDCWRFHCLRPTKPLPVWFLAIPR